MATEIFLAARVFGFVSIDMKINISYVKPPEFETQTLMHNGDKLIVPYHFCPYCVGTGKNGMGRKCAPCDGSGEKEYFSQLEISETLCEAIQIVEYNHRKRVLCGMPLSESEKILKEEKLEFERLAKKSNKETELIENAKYIWNQYYNKRDGF